MSLWQNGKTSYNCAWLNLVACQNIPLFGCLYVYMYYWRAKRVLTRELNGKFVLPRLAVWYIYIYIYIFPRRKSYTGECTEEFTAPTGYGLEEILRTSNMDFQKRPIRKWSLMKKKLTHIRRRGKRTRYYGTSVRKRLLFRQNYSILWHWKSYRLFLFILRHCFQS